jgi:site-specific DNA-methyltransferase (adenine-specific)
MKTIENNNQLSEYAWTSFDTPARIVSVSRLGVEKRTHPTQKPIKLYRWLLKNYAKKGDIILDTHVGSGSSLIACMEEGFDFIGFEIDPEYYENALRRMEESTKQLKLF